MPAGVARRLARIRLVAMDADGVLTDGRLYYGADGEVLKVFDVRDGFGIRQLLRAGVGVAIITGRGCEALERRAAELGIAQLMQGRQDKAPALQELCGAMGVPMAHCAYLGDDVPDVPALRAAALGMAPMDARAEAREAADWVGACGGGRGFVREVCDLVLGARP